MLRKTVLVWLLLICHAGIVMAQRERKEYDLNSNDSIKTVFIDGRKAFLDERLQQPFPQLGYREAIDHTTYDFDQPGRCRIILCSTTGCTGCRIVLPYFLALSNDSRYAGIDFLYISYNDSATIMKDITSQYHGRYDRVKLFSVSRDYFLYTDKPMLAYGFPTVHFADSRGFVRSIIVGGSRKATAKETAELLEAEWTKNINSLECL